MFNKERTTKHITQTNGFIPHVRGLSYELILTCTHTRVQNLDLF